MCDALTLQDISCFFRQRSVESGKRIPPKPQNLQKLGFCEKSGFLNRRRRKHYEL